LITLQDKVEWRRQRKNSSILYSYLKAKKNNQVFETFVWYIVNKQGQVFIPKQ
jgi:hypothetical protein